MKSGRMVFKRHIGFSLGIFLCCILQSCLQKTEFSEQDLMWMIPYDEKETVILKSLANDSIKKITIIEKKVYYPKYFGIDDRIREIAKIKYKINDGDRIYEMLEMYKDNNNEMAFPLIKFLGTTFWTDEYEFFYQTVKLKSSARVFDEVIILAYEKLEEPKYANEPMVLFWDKNEGIIKYITNSDEEWERINWEN